MIVEYETSGSACTVNILGPDSPPEEVNSITANNCTCTDPDKFDFYDEDVCEFESTLNHDYSDSDYFYYEHEVHFDLFKWRAAACNPKGSSDDSDASLTNILSYGLIIFC